MLINQELHDAVYQVSREIIEEFKTEGSDVNSYEFLSAFPYSFLGSTDSVRRVRILEAALSPSHRAEAEKAIEAGYSDCSGLSIEGCVINAVEDFLNYVIPRIIGLADEQEVFDRLYRQFDSSLFGTTCLVTVFGVLSNVWSNGGAVLPPGFALRHVDKVLPGGAYSRWMRDRAVSYFEISKGAHPVGRGRDIKGDAHYLLFEYSAMLPKDKSLIPAAYALRDDLVRKFIFSIRLLKQAAAFSDFRGFRTLGHLSAYAFNVMNFPEDYLDGYSSRELDEHDGVRLRRLLPVLASEKYAQIMVLDTKIEDALRRSRDAMGEHAQMKAALDQLLDYCQVLEAILPARGSEFLALYTAALLKEYGNGQLKTDPHSTYEFIKRIYAVRNEVMHGRVDDVLLVNKNKFKPQDISTFREMMHNLAGLYVMNGKLNQAATKMILGQPVSLQTVYPATPEKVNELRLHQFDSPSW